jgi:DNA-binding NarL/FixJ family response regulator
MHLTSLWDWIPLRAIGAERTLGEKVVVQHHRITPLSSEPLPGDAPIRVGIVDDHVMILESFTAMLQSVPDIEVVGTATSGADTLALVDQQRPDVLILDLMLPGVSGLEIARAIRDAHPAVAVLIVTGYDRTYDAQALHARGVRGYLTKTLSIAELVGAVRTVAAGLTPLSARAVGEPPAAVPPYLKEQEQAVLCLLAQGLHIPEIAAALPAPLRTVERRLQELRARLGACSTRELILKAEAFGLLTPPRPRLPPPAEPPRPHHRPLDPPRGGFPPT